MRLPRNRRIVGVARLLLMGLLVVCAHAGIDAKPGFSASAVSTSITGVSGKTVTVAVANNTSTAVRLAVAVQVVEGGTTHSASARMAVPAGTTVTVTIILGTITEDINPLDMTFGITEGPDPIPQ